MMATERVEHMDETEIFEARAAAAGRHREPGARRPRRGRGRRPAGVAAARPRCRTGADREIENLPAWLTTVTTRLCLDRLRARTPVPVEDVEVAETAPDPADDVALADTVGIALQAVIDRLSPRERVAFVLHDSFGFEFSTIAAVLDTTPAAARKLASRARSKVAQPAAEDALADWEVVDAFMAAARGGDFERLLQLLAPTPSSRADEAAVLAGTPASIEGRDEVADLLQRQRPGRARRSSSATARLGLVPPGRGQGGLRLHGRRRPGARHHLPRRARRPRPGRTPRRRRPALTPVSTPRSPTDVRHSRDTTPTRRTR